MSSVSDYQYLKKIGEGAYGEAILVCHRSNRNQLFVKKEMRFRNAEERKDCLAEVDLLRQMQHPNIVAYRDSFAHRDVVYLVMEYCSGGDLAQFLKAQKNHFHEQRIIYWTMQILDALKYLHDRPRPILHRDLKPGNIFMTDKQDFKLGDFGISRILPSQFDLTQTMCGTPLYLSPEICDQQPYGAKCDIWSLGCVVYEMMAFKPAINPLWLALHNKAMVNPMPTNYSIELVEIVKDMLQTDSGKRPTAIQCIYKIKPLCIPAPNQQNPGPIPSTSAAFAGGHLAQYQPDINLPLDSLPIHHARIQGDVLRTNYDDDEDSPSELQLSDDDLTLKDTVHEEKKDETLKNDFNHLRPIMTPARQLEQYGYRFNENGELRNIRTKERFNYEFHPSKADNERRYQDIAEIVQDFVGEQLEKDRNCAMHKIYLPMDFTIGEPVSHVYVTPDIFTNPNKLLIIVGGSDPVRAGIWSRRAVINDSIEAGSQIPYVRHARREGYAVLILNQNQTYMEVGGCKVPVRENEKRLDHVLHVWDRIILANTKAKRIAFVAHTSGGNVITELADHRRGSFEKLVFGVALCHCHQSSSFDKAPKEVADLLKTRSKFWMASPKPLDESVKKSGIFPFTKDRTDCLSAGDPRPEWTAHSSKDSVFQFLKDMEKQHVVPYSRGSQS